MKQVLYDDGLTMRQYYFSFGARRAAGEQICLINTNRGPYVKITTDNKD